MSTPTVNFPVTYRVQGKSYKLLSLASYMLHKCRVPYDSFDEQSGKLIITINDGGELQKFVEKCNDLALNPTFI